MSLAVNKITATRLPIVIKLLIIWYQRSQQLAVLYCGIAVILQQHPKDLLIGNSQKSLTIICDFESVIQLFKRLL
jgi:hypothetical protein